LEALASSPASSPLFRSDPKFYRLFDTRLDVAFLHAESFVDFVSESFLQFVIKCEGKFAHGHPARNRYSLTGYMVFHLSGIFNWMASMLDG